MSAPKSFSTSAKRAAGVQKPLKFQITHDPEDGGSPIVYDFEATMPTEDQMVLFALLDFDDQDEIRHSMKMLFDFLGGVVGSDGQRRLERMLAQGHITMEDLVGSENSVLAWIIEEWGNFPTQRSSDSSPTPGRTGKRSTGRQQRPVSTPSSSPSIGS
jgi:hypothetical protein